MADYSLALVDAILSELEKGRTLSAICRGYEGFPRTTFLQWVKDDRDGLADRYARARDTGYEAMGEDIIDIPDLSQDPAKARLQVDARKWVLSKMRPKTYGDKLDVTSEGKHIAGDRPDLSKLTTDELKAYRALVAKTSGTSDS